MSLSILWLGRTLPLPLNSGDRVYTAKLVGAVARAKADVVFLGLGNPDESMGDLAALDAGIEWRLVPGRPGVSGPRRGSPGAANAVAVRGRSARRGCRHRSSFP